jgi:hypothetical protein
MKKTTFSKFLIVFPLLIIISACTSSSQTGSGEINVRTGFAGLSLEMVKNTPPPKVFEGDVFPFAVRIKNDGAYSIGNGEKAVFSLGIEKDYTRNVQLLDRGKFEIAEGKSSSASFEIKGKTQIDPRGGEEIISYDIQAGKIDPQSEFHSSTAIASVCYPYETILDTTVCIDTDITDLRPGKKVCIAQDMNFPNGQGAPVAITKIETRMLPSDTTFSGPPSDEIKPQFLLYIENRGKGLVIREESVSEFCTKSNTDYSNYNIVYVDVCLANSCASKDEMKCQLEVDSETEDKTVASGHIKLKDNKDIIRCYLDKGIPRNYDSYLSPLRVTLKYGYTQSISSTYAIMKPTN